MSDARRAEIAKYVQVYDRHAHYAMARDRLQPVLTALSGLSGSLLDVSCGRGELMRGARDAGFFPVAGTEVVPQLVGEGVRYAELHALPFADGSHNVVTCIDVLEHLLEVDLVPALQELQRVTRRNLLLAVADYSTQWDGVELHPSARPYDAWDALFREVLTGEIRRVGRTASSEMWLVTYAG
jgi:ubiquinone/menaquinone biosynthesis C-methylase UbiE